MYTQEIHLVGTTYKRFNNAQQYWGLRVPLRQTFGFARIKSTFTVTGRDAAAYEELFNILLSHPAARSLNVNNQGEWQRLKVHEGYDDQQIEEFARIAANDGTKRNYLEVKLATTEREDWRDYSRVAFAEHQGNILIYHAKVHPDDRSLFSVENAKRCQCLCGILEVDAPVHGELLNPFQQ